MIKLIFGTGGLAKQIISFDLDVATCHFYNDFADDIPSTFENSICLRSKTELKALCESNSVEGIIAVGGTANRRMFFELEKETGIQPYTFISKLATISAIDVEISEGAVLMADSIVESGVKIGSGALINIKAAITHDVRIGAFSEIGPGAILLGACIVGESTTVGAGAIVLPKVKVGNNVVIGAGAVVTKDVPNGVIVKGVPGKW